MAYTISHYTVTYCVILAKQNRNLNNNICKMHVLLSPLGMKAQSDEGVEEYYLVITRVGGGHAFACLVCALALYRF